MKIMKSLFPGIISLFSIVTASGAHAEPLINSATIGDTTITNTTSPLIIEGQTFTWNGADVTVSRYPPTGSAKARIQIMADATSDTIGIFNAKFTATSPVTDFPINFESTGLGPAPTTPPTWYYVQGTGSFSDTAPLNGIITTIGKINPDPASNPIGWNQIGNTLIHNTGTCSCLTFNPSLGYKTYASSTFATTRGLGIEMRLDIGNENEAVQLSYVKVNNGPPPGTDESITEPCEIAKEEECETVTTDQGFWCSLFGICPRCSVSTNSPSPENTDVPITE